MDIESRKDKVAGLEAIKDKAIDMAEKGESSTDVRDFITSSRKLLAFEVPDEEAFLKAAKASGRFKKSKKK
tara:strand:+ start:402 stop:614 length:213 start_codon:yes stop_codon:yes gene_type:complete